MPNVDFDLLIASLVVITIAILVITVIATITEVDDE